MKKLFIILLMGCSIFIFSGCELKRDTLEGVDIYTTVYPIEFVVNSLYGYNSNVLSIYPADVNLSEYSLTDKQLDTYSKGAIFVYNGLTNEKSIARDMLNKNKKLKIIDVSQGLEYENVIEELWLNPKDYLMMSHNVKNGLEEYITNKYVIDEIEKNYEALKVLISSFDAELELIPANAEDKNIVIGSSALRFLEKYGFNITDISGDNVSNNTISKAKRLVQDKTVSYIFKLDSDDINDAIKEVDDAGAEVIEIRSMTVKKEADLKDGTTYRHMMRETIDAIKKEVYE